MSTHAQLGYLALIVAAAALVAAIRARTSEGRSAGNVMFGLLVVLLFSEAAALAAASIERLSIAPVSRPELLPFSYFLGSSLFTLTGALMVWRLFNPRVLAEEQHRVAYMAGIAALPLLTVALAVFGRLSG